MPACLWRPRYRRVPAISANRSTGVAPTILSCPVLSCPVARFGPSAVNHCEITSYNRTIADSNHRLPAVPAVELVGSHTMQKHCLQSNGTRVLNNETQEDVRAIVRAQMEPGLRGRARLSTQQPTARRRRKPSPRGRQARRRGKRDRFLNQNR